MRRFAGPNCGALVERSDRPVLGTRVLSIVGLFCGWQVTRGRKESDQKSLEQNQSAIEGESGENAEK